MHVGTRPPSRGRRYPGLFSWTPLFIVCLFFFGLGEAAVEDVIPCMPEPTDMFMRYGDLVTCQIDAIVDVDLFRFAGIVGEVVVLQITRLSGTGTPFIELFDPDGNLIRSAVTGRIDALLDQSGTHTIQVSEFFHNQTIGYVIGLERVVPPSPTARAICVGCIINDEINPVGDRDAFFFSGVAGGTINIQITRLSGNGTPFIELFDPEGGLLGVSVTGRIDAVLEQTGTHIIHVTDFFNDQTIGYALTFQCITGFCQDTVVILRAIFGAPGSLLMVVATSSAAPQAELFVTVPGCVTEAVMRLAANRYIFLNQVPECGPLDGETVTVRSNLGGTADTTIR